jgi:hypothetical protein
MTEALSKEEIERRIFEALAPLVGAEIVPESIRQAPPPAPDIECEAKDFGPWAIELVALDDPHTRTRLQNMRVTNQTWDRALATRSAAEQEKLKTRCDNMFLSIHIDEAAGVRDRTRIMSLIQDRILTLAAGFSGKIFHDVDAPPEVSWATIGYSHVKDGPHISTSSAGFWLPPQLDKIREKLVDKNYQTHAPLELFAYSQHDEVDGHLGGLEAIEQCVRAHLPGSLFQRVSVFNMGFLQLVYRYPT